MDWQISKNDTLHLGASAVTPESGASADDLLQEITRYSAAFLPLSRLTGAMAEEEGFEPPSELPR